MDPIVEVVALVLGFIGWVMVGIALPNRYWKTSTVDGSVITTSTIYENLWMSCATDSTGVHNCREFPSLLALNGYIQASRALMIVSVVLGSFGLVGALIGIQCSKAGGENYVLKGRIAGTAGVLFILQDDTRIHQPQILKEWFGEHETSFSDTDWPLAESRPDPSENLWDVPKNILRSGPNSLSSIRDLGE
ncbi:claudin-15a [Nematolebias whitei]|uniref:claudin-15a n=1 Tax=Nematolebias whitei TaxID=451745 RepID=UPI00189B1DF4|nr:claudin-15a [Nematolebias whitei]